MRELTESGAETGSASGRDGGAGSWGAFVGWSLLALAAAAAQCLATQAGPRVTYQHLRPPETPGTGWWISAAVLVAFVLATAAAAFARRHVWGRFLREHAKPWQLAVLLGVLFVSRAKIARPAEATVIESAVAVLLALAMLAAWALAAESLPRQPLERLSSWCGRVLGDGSRATFQAEPGGLDRFAWTLAAGATLVAACLSWFVYQRHPHVPDEVPYLLHARTFAAGRIALAAPPVSEAFDVDLMLQVGERWFSPVPPGWPLALAAGARFGAAWLVNPLLTGLCVLATYALAREVASRRTARLVALFAALSPWSLFLGMSFMTHSFANLCALLALLGVARARRHAPGASRHVSIGWCALAGIAIGVESWIRPLDGMVLALLCGLWAIGLGGARLPLAATASLVLATAASAALVLPYNRELTGRALRHPIMDYVDRVYGPGKNDLGFGPDKGLDWGGLDPWPGHTPFQALVNSQFNLFALDTELLGWTTGAVWLLALALLWSARERIVRAAAFAVALVVLANGLYWFSGGPDFGARYWYLAFPACLLLAAAGFEALRERLGAAGGRAHVALALACLSTLGVFVPWRALDKYRGYRGMQPGARELAAERGFGRSLVLVRGERHPDYASAAAYNPLDWEADAPIFAWDRGRETRAKLFAHYADRPVWILDGPTRTGDGFRVVAGPLTAEQAEASSAR